jgi:hypothetical protein
MPAKADETLEYRTVQHFASVQIQQVGDVNGHTLGLVRIPGIASFPDGSTAISLVIGTYDAVSSSGGSGSGYNTLHFDDGSELVLKYTGTFKYTTLKVPQTGTLTVIGGKGPIRGSAREWDLCRGRNWASRERRSDAVHRRGDHHQKVILPGGDWWVIHPQQRSSAVAAPLCM